MRAFVASALVLASGTLGGLVLSRTGHIEVFDAKNANLQPVGNAIGCLNSNFVYSPYTGGDDCGIFEYHLFLNKITAVVDSVKTDCHMYSVTGQAGTDLALCVSTAQPGLSQDNDWDWAMDDNGQVYRKRNHHVTQGKTEIFDVRPWGKGNARHIIAPVDGQVSQCLAPVVLRMASS